MTPVTRSATQRMAVSSPAGKAGTALLAGAAVLAAAALWNNARARQAERDHPPRGRFLEIDGTRLHYLERGAGPPVVLLHGNVVSAEDYVWSGVLDRVAERGIASWPSIAPASATAIGHRASYGRRQRRLDCSAAPSHGLASSARWSSAIPGAHWWPWRWRSTIRMR